MEDLSGGHLTADEVAGLIGLESPAGLREERVAHANSCNICQRIIAMHQEEDVRLRRLALGTRGGSTPSCPPVEDWAALAAGLAAAERSDELLAHAAGCDVCGARLRAVMEDFSSELTEAESTLLRGLASAEPAWQRQVAEKMAHASGRGRVVVMPLRSWLARAAAVIVAVGAGWMGWNQWMAAGPAHLLASAYTDQRPFDYRIPGADYAAARPQRRGGGPAAPLPQALLDARAKIAYQLEKDPASVKWLDLSARAEMLELDADAAIAALERSLRQKPGDAAALADLGMAYALRGDAQNRAADYQRAVDYLGRAIEARPDFVEAVFNRALVYERMSLYDDAARQWQRYLDLDKAGAWHDEARRRRDELAAKHSGR